MEVDGVAGIFCPELFPRPLTSGWPGFGHPDAAPLPAASCPGSLAFSPASCSARSAAVERALVTEVAQTIARRTVEAVSRDSYARLIAYLCGRTRDVAAAEDALSEALAAALESWARDGVPDSPERWLLTVARRRLIDAVRRDRRRSDNAATVELIYGELSTTDDARAIPDERLQLLFVCAHPAIDRDVHTPLMLQTVLGLEAAEIARAFLVSPAAMAQRLVRAKLKIRDAGIAFELPEPRELPERLEAVLDAIYAAYGSGWEDATGADPRARGLADEAIWLARVLDARLPGEPEVQGLLALMLYCEARRRARRAEDGSFVPLSQQDPREWNARMIDEAEQKLAAAASRPTAGRYRLEAAIQSVHAERARSGRTDWAAIAWFYEKLVDVAPTIGARVGHAVAVAELRGANAGLALLDAIDRRTTAGYQPWWAVRAHLLKESGYMEEAAQAWDRAIALTSDDSVRRFLTQKRR
jgi:predicted RNA polymerase sigma factor